MYCTWASVMRLIFSLFSFINETQHDKTNKMTCAHREDTDQHHLGYWLKMAKDRMFLHADSKTLIRLGGCPG